jgi:hypothetical protein
MESPVQANRGTPPPQAATDDRLPDAASYLRRAQARLRRKDMIGAGADLGGLRRDGPRLWLWASRLIRWSGAIWTPRSATWTIPCG